MKRKYRQLIIFGIIGILFFFILSLIFPNPVVLIISKLGALGVYGAVSFTQILMMKNNHEDIGQPVLFTVVVLLAVGYLLFFV